MRWKPTSSAPIRCGWPLRPDDPLTRSPSVSWKDLRDRPLINYMPNIAINVLSHVPPRHHPREMVPVHRVDAGFVHAAGKTGRSDLPLDGGIAGAGIWPDLPAAGRNPS